MGEEGFPEWWVSARSGTLAPREQALVWALVKMSELHAVDMVDEDIGACVTKVGGGHPKKDAIRIKGPYVLDQRVLDRKNRVSRGRGRRCGWLWGVVHTKALPHRSTETQTRFAHTHTHTHTHSPSGSGARSSRQILIGTLARLMKGVRSQGARK